MTEGRHHRRMGETDEAVPRLSAVSALRRSPWTVILLPAFVGLAVFIEGLTPDVYSATAQIIVEDPRASSLFEIVDIGRPSTQASERYLADQVAILQSTAAAAIASQLSEGQFEPDEFPRVSEVNGEATSNLIEVTVEAASPRLAKVGADALASAYLEIRRQQIEDTAELAISEVDSLLEATDNDLRAVNAGIEELQAKDADRRELEAQFDTAVSRLNEIRIERDALPIESLERERFNEQILELLRDFQTWEVILRTDEQGPEVDALIQQRTTLVAERSALATRRNSITVAVELVGAGVILYSPASIPEEPSSLRFTVILAAMTAVGIAMSVGTSYYLASRNPVIVDERLADGILGAPLLGVLPALGRDPNVAALPALAAPDSRQAQAFRFAGSALEIRASSSKLRSILALSCRRDMNHSELVANLGLSSVLAGLEVMVVDADFGRQRLTQLLSDAMPPSISGIHGTGGASAFTIQRVPVGAARHLSVLSRGTEPVEASRSESGALTDAMFGSISKRHDLVLFDSPSLFEAAYTATLARAVDGIVVVVEERTLLEDLYEVADRLDLIDTPIVGYVYVRAPSWTAARIASTWNRLVGKTRQLSTMTVSI